ncbi:MAG: biopolymer transporter ExbD [Gemmatimonadaceae bacterium]|nr:biopolymer transporter ExbD [Gemmatimonadaceae bacterium]
MRRGRRGERMGVNAEINVVSLIDVMMLLMIIFMITAPMMQGGVDISLPTAQVQPLEPKNGLVVTVDRNGRIFVDKTPLTFAEFEGSIKALSDRKGGGGVFVSADQRVDYGQVVRVLAAMRARGISDIGLVAEPEDAR